MSTTTPQETGVPTGTFVADTVHSSVGFEVPYAVATFSGTVPEFEAKLVDDRLDGSARIESIQLKDENLQGHLLSPEFFDAERHPVLTFSGELGRHFSVAVREAYSAELDIQSALVTTGGVALAAAELPEPEEGAAQPGAYTCC